MTLFDELYQNSFNVPDRPFFDFQEPTIEKPEPVDIRDEQAPNINNSGDENNYETGMMQENGDANIQEIDTESQDSSVIGQIEIPEQQQDAINAPASDSVDNTVSSVDESQNVDVEANLQQEPMPEWMIPIEEPIPAERPKE